MQVSYLSNKTLDAFLRFHYRDKTDDQIEENKTLFLGRIASGKRSFEDYIIITDQDELQWSYIVFPDEEDSYGVQTPKFMPSKPIASQAWAESIKLLKGRLVGKNPKKASLRFIQHPMTSEIPKLLHEFNFKKHLERIEFSTPLKDLPTEDDTPLNWKSVGKNITLEFAADIMNAASEGDPGADPNGDALAFLTTDLKDDVLYCGLDSVQVGYIDNKPAAFIFAQVDQRSGWSRITYMGLLPEFRAKGLGKWVHRHGFEMMRQQGGIIYNGGTSTENQSMLATFKKHGCKEISRMEEWVIWF